MKRCARCELSKPLEDFHVGRHSADGRQGYCRDCNLAQFRDWSKTPRGRLSAKERRQRRRAVKAGATVERFSAAEMLDHLGTIAVDAGGQLQCFYCLGAFEAADHVVPLNGGGLHALRNLAPACARCNSSKGKRALGEWAPQMVAFAETLGLEVAA